MVLILIFTYCKGMSWMTCVHGVWALRGNNISFYTRKHTYFHFLKFFFIFFFIRTKEILRKECNFRSWTTVPGLTWVPALGSFGMELCVVNSTDQTQAFLNDRLSCMTFWLTKRNFYAMLFFFFVFFIRAVNLKCPRSVLYTSLLVIHCSQPGKIKPWNMSFVHTSGLKRHEMIMPQPSIHSVSLYFTIIYTIV